jgi:RNA polymerase sigma-70 factor (ECF subfamily)
VSSPPSQEVAEARRQFDAACEALRPDLHRFCTRMLGDPCDGEDVVHDTLVLAFYRLSELRDGGALRGWLFRIAHNKCIDLLRARRRSAARDDRSSASDGELDDLIDRASEDRAMDDRLADKQRTERVLASMVTELPPRERACVMLKDVLDCTLDETAEVVGSSVGAVKAALHRGRDKLERAERAPRPDGGALPARHRELIERYLAAFNRRDWSAVLALVSDDAQLQVVHRTDGPLRDAVYFTNYERLSWRWKLAVARVDGAEAIVHFREIDGAWQPHAIVQLAIDGDRIATVRDYVHVDYLLRSCVVE